MKRVDTDLSTHTCDGPMPLMTRCGRCGQAHFQPPSTAPEPRRKYCQCGLALVWPDGGGLGFPRRMALPVGSTGNPDLDALLKDAVTRYNAMTPAQQAEMWEAQRQGYAAADLGDEGTRPAIASTEQALAVIDHAAEFAAAGIKPFECVYTNWRGETWVRRLLIRNIYWASNQWHKEEQMLVDAYDCDACEIRSFALKDMVPRHIADAHDARVTELLAANNREVIKRRAAEYELAAWKDNAAPIVARTLAEYHEDMGDVLWFQFPIKEPPLVSSPLSDDWPGYHTHFILLPDCQCIVPA